MQHLLTNATQSLMPHQLHLFNRRVQHPFSPMSRVIRHGSSTRQQNSFHYLQYLMSQLGLLPLLQPKPQLWNLSSSTRPQSNSSGKQFLVPSQQWFSRMQQCHSRAPCQPYSSLHSIERQCYSTGFGSHQLDHLWPIEVAELRGSNFRTSPYSLGQESPLDSKWHLLQKRQQVRQPILSMIWAY